MKIYLVFLAEYLHQDSINLLPSQVNDSLLLIQVAADKE